MCDEGGARRRENAERANKPTSPCPSPNLFVSLNRRARDQTPPVVMPALDPGIHVLAQRMAGPAEREARIKSAHDECGCIVGPRLSCARRTLEIRAIRAFATLPLARETIQARVTPDHGAVHGVRRSCEGSAMMRASEWAVADGVAIWMRGYPERVRACPRVTGRGIACDGCCGARRTVHARWVRDDGNVGRALGRLSGRRRCRGIPLISLNPTVSRRIPLHPGESRVRSRLLRIPLS